MAANSVSLFYNPEFVDTLNAGGGRRPGPGLMHPVLQHHTRRGDCNQARWNMACDYAIHPLPIDAGLKLPEGVLLDGRFRGMSAEQIYNLLEPEEGTGEDDNNGDDQSGSAGGSANAEPAAGGSGVLPLRRQTEGCATADGAKLGSEKTRPESGPEDWRPELCLALLKHFWPERSPLQSSKRDN
jgi:hypothetical protein